MKRKMLFMVTAIALLVAACSTESSKVLPKKPVITEQPSDNQYSKGNEVVPLTVTAETKDKKAKLSYQWYSNTSRSNKNGTRIDGATGALTSKLEGGEYTPPIDLTEDVAEEVYYYYYVEVTSTLGKEKSKTASDVAIIKVVPDKDVPKVINTGGNEETGTGDDILLVVQLPDSIEEIIVSGEAEVFYQWYDNGPRNSNVGGEIIEGATEASYYPPTEIEGTRYYYVVITVKDKETGEVIRTMTSNQMRVTVIVNTLDVTKVNAGLPTIMPADEPVGGTWYVDLADTNPAVLTVTATTVDRNGFLSYQWYSNTEFGYEGGTLIEDARSATYYPPMATAGEMYYYVEVTNTIPDNGDGGLKSRSKNTIPARVIIIKGLDAQAPSITTQPANPSSTYAVGATIPALTVVASVTAAQTQAGAKLTYQWYRFHYDSDGQTILDEIPVPPFPENNTDPTYGKIASFIPPNVKSIWYYYVVVTNTLPPAEDGATKVATTRSNTVSVGVGLTAATLNSAQLTVANKLYDGTVFTTWSGAPSITGKIGNDDVYVVFEGATVEFPNANVGSYTMIWKGWTLGGAQREEYLLQIPAKTASIQRAAGSTVTKPVVSVDVPPTSSTITVQPVTLDSKPETLQTIQYSSNNSTWQTSTTFTGLSAGTNYRIYARAAESTNYSAGASNSSEIIRTLDPVVRFVYTTTNGSVVTENLISETVVTMGTPVTKPGNPTRDSYIFDYWYTSSALTTPFDFNNTINGNTTIYAKWVLRSDINTMATKVVPMVWVSGGVFQMGSPAEETAGSANERPRRRVNMSGYWVGKYEVTQDVFNSVMGWNPSYWTAAVSGETNKLPVQNVSYYNAIIFCNKLSVQDGLTPAYQMAWSYTAGNVNNTYTTALPSNYTPNYTGTDVTKWPPLTQAILASANSATGANSNSTSTNTQYWRVYGPYYDAVRLAYNNISIVSGANGYRLPTEAQWEYAARGGTDTPFVIGTGSGSTMTASTATGWYNSNSGVTVSGSTTLRSHQVGLKPAMGANNYGNVYGVCDMHGNVAEWCWDWYLDRYYQDTATTVTNPTGPSRGTNTQRVLRGGYFNSAEAATRSAYRIGAGDCTYTSTSYNWAPNAVLFGTRGAYVVGTSGYTNAGAATNQYGFRVVRP